MKEPNVTIEFATQRPSRYGTTSNAIRMPVLQATRSTDHFVISIDNEDGYFDGREWRVVKL